MSSWGRPAFLGALLCAILAAPSALAHVGGIPTRPSFVAPLGIVRSSGEALELRWQDNDTDPTGAFVFELRGAGGPPEAVPEPSFVDSVLTVGTVEIKDTENLLDIDLTTLPTGAWNLFARTQDPPFCEQITFAAGVILLHRAEDPAPVGAVVTEPSGFGRVIDEEGTITVVAAGPEAPVISLEAGFREDARDIDPDGDPCQPVRTRWIRHSLVAAEVTMEPAPDRGEELWQVEVPWVTDEVPVGDYSFRVVARNSAGKEHVSFSSAYLTVYHRNPIQSGGEDTESTSAGPDIGTAAADASSSPGTGNDLLEANQDGGAQRADTASTTASDIERGQDTGATSSGGCGGGPALPLWPLMGALFLGRRSGRRGRRAHPDRDLPAPG